MIEVSHLTKHYGARSAIDDLCFEVNRGEIVGFLGPNGAGKSTTMKILTGYMPATEGKAIIAGFDVSKNPIEVKRQIGYLPETPPVYLDMKVRDYVEYAARLHDVPRNKVRSMTDIALEKARVGDVQNRLIGNLSKGYRQRVGLAQALVHNPQVLILDEPTVGLDPKQIIEIRSLVKGLAGDHTVILSSHILPEVTATCQRIIVLNKGKIVAQDSIEQLSHRMNRGLEYRMLVKNPITEGISRLTSIKGVSDIKAKDGHLTIQIENGTGDIREALVSAAVQAGMGVLEFGTEKLSLEEVFLQLTTDEPTALH